MSQSEFLEAIISADGALITALKDQREQLRSIVLDLLNCVDPDRDMAEIRKAHKILSNTKI